MNLPKLMLAKVITSPIKKVCTVTVPHLVFNDYVKAHYKEKVEFETLDENEQCKPGDWVLIEELPERLSLRVNHRIKKNVFEAGNIIDPLTGKKCFSTSYTEDIDEESQLYGGMSFSELKAAGLEQLQKNQKVPSGKDVNDS